MVQTPSLYRNLTLWFLFKVLCHSCVGDISSCKLYTTLLHFALYCRMRKCAMKATNVILTLANIHFACPKELCCFNTTGYTQMQYIACSHANLYSAACGTRSFMHDPTEIIIVSWLSRATLIRQQRTTSCQLNPGDDTILAEPSFKRTW